MTSLILMGSGVLVALIRSLYLEICDMREARLVDVMRAYSEQAVRYHQGLGPAPVPPGVLGGPRSSLPPVPEPPKILSGLGVHMPPAFISEGRTKEAA